MNNGFSHLYGRDDYESNYSEEEPDGRPLYKHFGYRSWGEMHDAQREYAKRKQGRPEDDFEVVA